MGQARNRKAEIDALKAQPLLTKTGLELSEFVETELSDVVTELPGFGCSIKAPYGATNNCAGVVNMQLYLPGADEPSLACNTKYAFARLAANAAFTQPAHLKEWLVGIHDLEHSRGHGTEFVFGVVARTEADAINIARQAVTRLPATFKAALFSTGFTEGQQMLAVANQTTLGVLPVRG